MGAMTALEAKAAFGTLAKKVGPKAEFSVYLTLSQYRKDDKALSASLYATERWTAGALFACQADTWEELLEAAEAKWVEHCDEHRRRTILDMAVAIIRITDEFGQCSDQMLRVEFDAGSLKRFGADACVKANEMAGRGPFTITQTAGANARAA